MKIIHCADIHIDSPMKRLNAPEKKKERKAELIAAFSEMIDFAAAEAVRAILIAGDLFDQTGVSAGAKRAVLEKIKSNPGIAFFYIRGNHDGSNELCNTDELPSNLYTFDDKWKSFDLGENVFLTAAELTDENAGLLSAGLDLDINHFNIVSLHGQEASASGDNAQLINIREFKNKNIDYFALGHVHSYKCESLDGRGIYCYPGCLEQRGFDETGEHGYVLLDIDTTQNRFDHKLMCNPKRSAHVLSVDISGLKSDAEIMNKTDEALAAAAYPEKDMVKVELCGEVDIDCEKNPVFIEKQYEDKYFDFKLKDVSIFKVDYGSFRLDESLKGEFIRTVESETDLSKEDKAEIIRLGIRALMGEEVE